MLGSSVWACHFVCLAPLFRLIRCLPLFVIYMPDLAPLYLLFCSWGSMLQVIQWLFFGLSSVFSCSLGCFSATRILDVQVSPPLTPPVNHQHSRATSFTYYGLCFCHHCSNYNVPLLLFCLGTWLPLSPGVVYLHFWESTFPIFSPLGFLGFSYQADAPQISTSPLQAHTTSDLLVSHISGRPLFIFSEYTFVCFTSSFSRNFQPILFLGCLWAMCMGITISICHLVLYSAWIGNNVSALQAATILVAMASEKKNWRLNYRRKSPFGDQRI